MPSHKMKTCKIFTFAHNLVLCFKENLKEFSKVKLLKRMMSKFNLRDWIIIVNKNGMSVFLEACFFLFL